MRPLAVTLIGFYQILRGVLYALFACSILAFAGLGAKLASLAAEGNAMQRYLGSFGHMAGLVVLVAAGFHLAAGYGILQMQNWGRLLTLLFSAVGLVLLIPFLHFPVPLIFASINALTIFYLALPAVKRAFHADSRALRMAA
jgi:hypothetical protein